MSTVPGRNAPCPCGSGRKYKKCCLEKDAAERATRPPPAAPGIDGERSVPKENPGGQSREKTLEGPAKAPSHQCRRDSRLPTPNQQEQALVENWWREVGPIYWSGESEEVLGRVREVLDRQPGLFVHLGLEEECLFELGASLEEAGRKAEYVALLERLHREQPLTYELAHGWFDRDVIRELLLTGRRSEIAGYLEGFKRDPDGDPDNLADLVHLLLAVNAEAELLELVRAVAVEVYKSRRVIDGWFVLGWRIFEPVAEAFARGDASEEAIRSVLETLEAMELPIDVDEERIRNDICNTLGPAPPYPRPEGCNRLDYGLHLLSHFTRWLHDERGLSWVSSRYFGELVVECAMELEPKQKAKRAPRQPAPASRGYVFERSKLEQYFEEHLQNFLGLDEVQTLSLLQGIHWFADYLSFRQVEQEPAIAALRNTAGSLAAEVRAREGGNSTGAFEDLAAYRWAGPKA